MKVDYEKVFATPRKRKELTLIFGMGDRFSRVGIRKGQKSHKLVNFQDGKGYFIGDNKDGIRYSFQEIHRGKSSIEKACDIITQCQFENIEGMEDFTEEVTYCIDLLYKILAPIKKDLYEQKNIKYVPVKQHVRRVGTGDLQGQQRIEVR